jgi:hypothetical protein
MDVHFLPLVFHSMQHLFLLMSGLPIMEHIIIWLRLKTFSTFNECNIKQILASDNRFLSVVGFRRDQQDGDHFNDVLCFEYFIQPSIHVSDHRSLIQVKLNHRIFTSPSCNKRFNGSQAYLSNYHC